ncbi:MAG: class D beta-lactamase [Myxococcales bacterium]|nr:class D beta-lactamase [Myxococcales bacterium]
MPLACAAPQAGAAPPASAAPSSIAAPAPANPPAVAHPGCFLLQDLATGVVTSVHPERCARALVPASTFKIPHALIALELGVVTDPRAEVPWDGTLYTNKDWQAPQSLASALQVSCVWFFQGIARAVGRSRMQARLRALRYGNMQVSRDLTGFWLEGGSLTVTGPQQLDYLRRMANYELPVARRHIDTVWSLLRADPRLLAARLPAGETWPESAAIIEAKTGTADGVSWWVGRITGPRGAHVFVSRVDGLPASHTSAALSAGLRALADAGLL